VTSLVGALGNPTTDDNFTRNDVFFNPSPLSAMNTAPVIPTCAQYGLAIVSSSGTDSNGHSCSTTSNTTGSMCSATDESSLGVPEAQAQTHQSSTGVGGGTGERSEQERDHVHNRLGIASLDSPCFVLIQIATCISCLI